VGGTLLAELNSAGGYGQVLLRGSTTPTEGPGSGVQLLDQLLIREKAPRSKVILTTGFLEKDLRDHLQKLGISKMVNKPYSFGELAFAIRESLDTPIVS